jgi:hypothetical protein
MINGWLSLRVEDAHRVAAWCQELGFEIVGKRPDVGGMAIGTGERVESWFYFLEREAGILTACKFILQCRMLTLNTMSPGQLETQSFSCPSSAK